MTPEVNSQIAVLRQKARDNTLSIEEMRQAIGLLRGGRVAAATSSAKARSTRAKEARQGNLNGDDLLKELEGL